MILTVVAIALIVVMAMAIARALLGPTIYDRILAVNLFGTKTVLLIAVVSYIFGRPDFLDIALIYALINFISVIAVLRFFEYGSSKVNDKVGEDG
ncbi:MAG: pH regulation protein F [Spongiibacteraceae bacterium]|jgi:multicomponent Na+:H+ antiporter subunit F|nr:pH regulation protein F [Spongiibacteraceae bacterium]